MHGGHSSSGSQLPNDSAVIQFQSVDSRRQSDPKDVVKSAPVVHTRTPRRPQWNSYRAHGVARRRSANIRTLQGGWGGCDVDSGLDTVLGGGGVSDVVGLVRPDEADTRLRLL